MDDLTRALVRRIAVHRRWALNAHRHAQRLFTTNNQKIIELASAVGNRGVNREANWDSLITQVISLRARYRETSEKLRDTERAHLIDKGTFTDVEIAHLIEQGWTPPPGTRVVRCRKGPYDCWATAGHDGNCVPTY